jgi:DNA-binding IclR family transcriptional regulator
MPDPTLTTVDKALSLLRHFTVHTPEIGLSDLSRLAGHDKTTILRCMGALIRHGFIEQDAVSRKYRLGLAPIALARLRERSFPLLAVLQPPVQRLRDATQETAHATMLSSGQLLTALVSEPERAARVILDPAADLPLHATASGLVILAHLPQADRAALIAQRGMTRYTDTTPTTPARLEEACVQIRADGFARADQSYEADVIGTATAFFGPQGRVAGAIAVAAVASRFDAALATLIETELRTAAAALTRAFGGTPPLFPKPEPVE